MFNVGSVQGYLKLNTTGWNTAMGRANASLAGLSRTMMRFGALATGSILLITREFGKFDKAIRHATSVSETTEAQFKQMSEMALDASVQWNKAAADTAQAFYYLGSAGLSVTEQMQAFNNTIMLSRAMGSELEATSQGLVDVIKAFGLEFSDSRAVADQLTKTVISANLHFQDLDKSLAYVGSTARFTNNTLAETTAMLGVMANAGIRGSMAGTILRRAFANLMSPTAEMRRLIYQLGLNVYDATGKMRPYIEILGQIGDALANSSDEYKNLVFRILFGVRAIGGQIQLLNYGSEALQKYADSIRDAGGAAERVASKQMMAFSEQLGRLWQTIRKVAIHLGELLAPSIEALANKIRDGLGAFTDYIEANKEAVTNTLKWAAALGAVTLIGIPLITMIGALGLQIVAVAGLLLNPWVALVTALYVVRAVWKETFNRGGELNKALDEFSEVLKDWLINTFGVFGKAMVWIGQKTVEGWTEIFELFGKMGKPEGIPMPPGTGEVIDKAKTLIGEIAATVKNQFKQDVQDLGGIITEYLPPSMQDAYASLRELLSLFLNPPEVQKVMDALPEQVKESTDKVNEVSVKAAGVWAETWKRAVHGMMDSMSSLFDLFTDVLTDIKSSWTSTIETFINEGGKFKDFIENMFLDVLRAFNHMVAEMLARRLMYQLFGSWMGAIAEPGYIPGVSTYAKPAEEVVSMLPSYATESYKRVPDANVTINLANKSGTPLNARTAGQYWNGRSYVVNVVMDEYNTNPSFRNALGR